MKIKVLHILNSPSIGGIETFVYYLTQVQLNNPELEIALLFSRPNGNLKERFRNTGIKCFFLDIKPFDPDYRKYTKLVKVTRDYDIVHYHTFLPIRDLLTTGIKAKKIFTQHSVDGFGRVKKVTSNLRNMMLRNFLNEKVDYVTYNSNYTKHFWEDRGISNKQNRIVYNGVTFDADQKTTATNEPLIPVDTSKFIVGTTSRFISWKRVDLLIRAFEKFQVGKDDVTLLLVGDGTDMERLASLVQELKIEGKVLFTGFTTNASYYQSIMNLCVFPSMTEAFGLVAIECMYLGKPVLVFQDGGGITELISKVEPDNIVDSTEALALRINQYYDDRSLLAGENFEKRMNFAKQFDMKIAESEFFNIYKELL